MKPRNFPGRKNIRRVRAKARLNGEIESTRNYPAHPTVADIRFRCGRVNRDAITGIGRGKA